MIEQTTKIAENTSKQLILAVADSEELTDIEQKKFKENEFHHVDIKSRKSLKQEVINEIVTEDVDPEELVNMPNEDECPACFAHISPTDTECPNCGYILK